MNNMNVLIVDDERKSRESLSSLLAEYCPDVRVTGVAANIEEASHQIREKKPDTVFLDIMMPGGTGFQLLEQLSPIPFHVIFTTSYNQYAIQAIRFSAIDYLLKPVVSEELRVAVNSARSKNRACNREERISLLRKSISEGLEKIAFPTMEGFHFVAADEIEFCEADNNYTRIYLLNKSQIFVSKTLKDVEALLCDMGFFRIHQSYLVNLMFIKKFVKSNSSLITQSGKELSVSSRRKEDFIRIFKRL